MSKPSKNNKENFRLLDMSSDEESEDLQLEIIPRKKKIARRDRHRGGAPKIPEVSFRSEVQTALQWALRGTILLWLLALTWSSAALYEQVTKMHTDIVQVSTSSEGVGDALQLCHTAAKELRANASELNNRLLKLERDHDELAKRVEQASGELAAVSQKLAAAPELADTPKRIAQLQRTVADLGSQIKDFDASLTSAHKQAEDATTGVDAVKLLLHDLEAKTNETITNVTANAKKTVTLDQQLLSLNNTLETKVGALQSRIQVLTQTTTAVPPTTKAVEALKPAATTPTTTTSTTTLAPGPPVKPSVVH